MTDADTTLLRLSKLMAMRGLCSRREADDYIERGWVSVNGEPAILGQKVLPSVQITLDRRAETTQSERVTILLNKPVGYVSAQAEKGYIPVIAPIGVGRNGEAFNINADLVAGRLAKELTAERLIMMTNTPGILDKEGKLLTDLTPKLVDDLIADGTLSGGMLPKIASALDAATSGVKATIIIDGRVPHALLLELFTNAGVGSMILDA